VEPSACQPLGRQYGNERDPAFRNVAFSPDGTYLVLTAGDGSVQMWRVSSGERISFRPPGRTDELLMQAIVFPRTARCIGASSEGKGVQIYDLFPDRAAARAIGSLLPAASVRELILSPDGRFAAIVDEDRPGRIELWDVNKRRLVGRWDDLGRRLELLFSPDGAYLAAGGDEGTVRVWETEPARLLAQLRHLKRVNALAFSKQGFSLATASDDGTGRVWLCRLEDLRDEACARLPHNLSKSEWNEWVRDQPCRKSCPKLPSPPSQ
jgi:WD40 repeat protein